MTAILRQNFGPSIGWRFFCHTQRQSSQRKLEPLTCGILVTGDEVLKGQVLDTNSYFLCKNLYEMGIRVLEVTKVGDDVKVISTLVKAFSEKFDYVLTTGGIGPTHDDVTYEAVGKAFDDTLHHHPELTKFVLDFYKTNDTKHPALKMAYIPTTSKLTFGYDPVNKRRALYPNISVRNVYMFPGVPQLCERLFNFTKGEIFKNVGKFHQRLLHLTETEGKIINELNDAVEKFPGVAFGSYPKFFHSYYNVKISMESVNESEVNAAFEHLKSLIPVKFHVDFDEDPFTEKYKKITRLQNAHLKNLLTDVQRFIQDNDPNYIFVYFDGGKNATLLLHIMSALWEHHNLNIPINAIYVEINPKVNKFIETSVKNYNLTLLKLNDDNFRNFTKSSFKIRLVKATRKTDPNANKVLGYFEGLPVYNPIPDWSYEEVWKIIRALSLPYCELYDQGYTSICRENPRPNPHLVTTGPRADLTYYKKAFELEDGSLENAITIPVRCLSGINKWNEEYSRSIQLKIEKHWKTKLPEERFDPESNKEKFYILSMFPYPSGYLHMGHVRVYGTSDALARYFRMKGKNVIHPMGWDAFGLPAENAAFERGIDPDHWTQTNIANMKSVMEELNFSFDWDREFATCDSDYYKWTQFLFLKLYEMGLVYRDEGLVNWDPIDQTVLADEQVNSEGRSWRSGAVVEKKKLKQWFVKTSAFAKSLLEGLSDPILEGWKDVTKIQKHWIGDVNGTCIDFEIVDKNSGTEKRRMVIYLQQPEYIHRGKFIAVKKDSKWCVNYEGDDLMPFGAKNPFTGEVLPVYRTDSVSYYQGADTHFGIPELNEGDREFADSTKIKYTLEPVLAKEEELIDLREKICAEARERGIGGYPTSSSLKDWLISRQRYWGTPIPIIHCQKCGEQPVPEKDLPVRLPGAKAVRKGLNALEKQEDWVNTVCPKCGGEAKRETDTMDTFVDSSWYFLRFLDPDNERAAFGVDKVRKLMPVDVYIGGIEHAVLHLFYARFMNHFLHSVGLVPHREPFKRLVCMGMVKAFTYKTAAGEFIKPELVAIEGDKAFHKETKEVLVGEWEKMSKSKHNSVEPKKLLKEYGIDMTRLVIICSGMARSELQWSEKLFHDMEAWQRRMWLTVQNFINLRNRELKGVEKTEEFDKLEFFIFDSRNFYLEKITGLIEKSLNMSVAVKKMQALTNSLRKCNDDVVTYSSQFERTLAVQIILLAPFAPYFASELWAGFLKAPNRLCKGEEIRWDRSVFEQPWPEVDKNYVPGSDKIKEMVVTAVDKAKQKKGGKKSKKMGAEKIDSNAAKNSEKIVDKSKV